AEQNEGLAYTTRVNCAETTITLCADNLSAHNVYYVKLHVLPNNSIFDSGLLTNQHGTYL
ncbi:hypothetical protein, partial [Klebsiella quasipneumoniae]|uniref:hypothetical protein n=1 Tax=Klebsiella quasipneumoniae TaxID=1463165 RepID=UPI001BAD6645